MINPLCHIVAIDEITKKNFISTIIKLVNIVDLDLIQYDIHNCNYMKKLKNEWKILNTQILNNRKVIKLNNIRGRKLIGKNNNLMNEQSELNKKIHNYWIKKMIHNIEKIDDPKIILGFNIFPKDYRVKIELSPECPKIIYKLTSNEYTSNQIKYYLKTFENAISKGEFNMDLIKYDFIKKKYDKFTKFYLSKGYHILSDEQIFDKLNLCEKHKFLYIATRAPSKELIPVNTKTPVQAFLTKRDAVNNIRKYIKKNDMIYIYEIDPKTFEENQGKYFTKQLIFPLNEDVITLSEI
jgi:hypothetical protein